MEKKISRLPFKMINVFFSVALDLILHGPPRTVHRRHSVSVCQTPPPPAADRSSAAAAARRKAMHQNKQFSLGMREKKMTERVRKNATQTQRAKQRISVDDDIPSPESVISSASSMVSFNTYNQVSFIKYTFVLQWLRKLIEPRLFDTVFQCLDIHFLFLHLKWYSRV